MTQVQPLSRPLGRFRVTTDREAIDSFRRATGCSEPDETVPTTFPITWIAEPKLADILVQLYETVGAGQALVLQIEQQFNYLCPLAADSVYILDMIFEGPDDADNYRLFAAIADADGASVLDMVSTFVFVNSEIAP